MSIKSLKDVVLAQAAIDIPGTDQSFGVGALSFNDLVALMYRHKEPMAAVYMQFVQSQAEGKPTGESVKSIAAGAADEVGPLLAGVIARAAGHPDDEDVEAKAARLPMPAQLDALEKIAVLTFGRLEDGGVKKFVESVTRAMGAAGSLARSLTDSNSGSITSAKK